MSPRPRPARRVGPACAALAVFALVLTGCGSAAAPSDAPAGTVAVVASTNVYGSIAAAVGGRHVGVTSIIEDPVADPHSYEATPANAAAVAGAALVVRNGGGYDDFMGPLVDASGGTATVVDVVALSGLPGATEAGTEHDDHGGAGDDHGAFNEHVWYSLPTMQKLAGQLATDLGRLDAAHAAEYTANAQSLAARLQRSIDRLIAAKQAHGGEKIALTEPVAGYLVANAGLVDATPPAFSAAVEEDTDPPATVLQETLRLVTERQVRVLLLNGQTQTPVTDQVKQAATGAGLPVVEVGETLPAGVTDYAAWMDGQVTALTDALVR